MPDQNVWTKKRSPPFVFSDRKYDFDHLTTFIMILMCLAYLTSLHQLHNQEEVLIVFVNVVELDNVGVVDLLKNVDFILQADFVFLGKFAPKESKKTGTSSKNEQISSTRLEQTLHAVL